MVVMEMRTDPEDANCDETEKVYKQLWQRMFQKITIQTFRIEPHRNFDLQNNNGHGNCERGIGEGLYPLYI